MDIVEVDDSGKVALPHEFLNRLRPHARLHVEVEGTALKLVAVEEEPVRTKEEAEAWARSFREWVAGLDPKAPHLPDEALRRETFYD